MVKMHRSACGSAQPSWVSASGIGPDLRRGANGPAGRVNRSKPWQAPWYVGTVERTLFDILAELFARDADQALLRSSAAKTPTERLRWLQDTQAFADAARVARAAEPVNEASRATQAPR